MKSPVFRFVAAALFVLASVPSGVAQDGQPLARYDYWDVHVLDGPDGRICIVASLPIESRPQTVTRNGQQVPIQRGEIMVVITDWPADGVQNEIQIRMGYPIDTDVTVTIDGGPEFTLANIQDEIAWFRQGVEFQDDLLTDEMKRGRRMEVRATSTRGTDTFDVYSLVGITAALARSAEECS